MAFRGLMGGGASVDTVLHDPRVYPGGVLQGTVNVVGGHTDRDVNFIELALTARVEVETDDSEYNSNVEFNKRRISGPFRLAAGARFPVPFTLDIPWEAPFNVVAGTTFHGVRVGVRTELDIARSVDKGDVDQIQILALPAQERIVTAFAEIGFRLKGSDLERGRLSGSPLPFYQEVEFHPAPQFRGQVNELEVKFVTRSNSMDVVLEIDRRSVFGSSDKTNRFTVDFATVDHQDWPSVLNDHLARIMGGGSFGGSVSRHAAPVLNTPPPQFGGPPPAPAYGAPPAPAYGAPPAYGTPPPAPAYGTPPPAPAYGAPPAYGTPPPAYGTPPPAPAYNAPPPPPPPAPAYNPAPPAAPVRSGQGGGINLSKGGNVNLSQQANGLTAVSIGLGWDVSSFGGGIDIDASAIVAGPDGRALSDQHFVFFNNLNSPDGAVVHAGDNSTGAGSGDDEQILVDLVRLAANADKIAFAVSIHDGQEKGQNFGQVRNAYIRVVNRADNREIARYDLSAQAYSETAMIFGELYRHGADWKFRAVGQGFADGLAGIIRSFGL